MPGVARARHADLVIANVVAVAPAPGALVARDAGYRITSALARDGVTMDAITPDRPRLATPSVNYEVAVANSLPDRAGAPLARPGTHRRLPSAACSHHGHEVVPALGSVGLDRPPTARLPDHAHIFPQVAGFGTHE